jgi:beta-glucosidase
VEGAVETDGRGPSIWDTFCATPGAIRNGDNGSRACDFYHRYREDIALMRDAGIDAFRFSISWPRILPSGRGPINAAGLDFYERLVEELLTAGIQPFPTLYHWDLPQALEDAGGWPARETAEAFAEYASIVGDRLGDRVEHWMTHNEPYCSSWLGYVVGVHAPGRKDRAAGAAAVHHVLLSHGLAVQALRATCPNAEVGIVLDSWPIHPATADPADIEAARQVDGARNRLFFDPVLRGEYPVDVLAWLGSDCPRILDGDLETISTPIDFVGINNYSRRVVRAGAPGEEPIDITPAENSQTGLGWEIYPNGLREVIARLHREYNVETIYVTENGAAFPDVRDEDGEVRDLNRVAYLEGYLTEVARAIAEGAPVRGYFAWSLLDNFEWAQGYSQRFGIVYVDFETLERIPKSSYYWYGDLIAASRRGVELVR